MPELAEVEYGRRLAERATRGKTIQRVWCDDDDIVFDKVAPDAVREALEGARVEEVHRRGKHLWFALNRRPWPLFHFGMTGAFRTRTDTPLTLASTPKGGDVDWPPRFAKIRITLDDGADLVMTNKRRLGRIRLRDNPRHEPPISKLGFDPLLDLPDAIEFAGRLGRRKAPVKAVLLDQGFAAGVGNWLADEICYQAGIDPRTRAHTLSEAQHERLRCAMRDIVKAAVDADAVKTRFPPEWLFHRRWGKPTGATTLDGHPIETLQVGGRTTAWVPAVQK